jgi:uncharacterized protein (TIGR02147 family)
MKSAFDFASYKDFLRDQLLADGKRGQITRAAQAIGCEKSFLSRVINGELHLTPDHAFKVAKFLQLDFDCALHFRTQVDCERAGDREFKDFLQRQLDAQKKKHQLIQKKIQRKDQSFEALQQRYFSNWIWSAIHFLVSIPEFQTESALAKRLGMPEAQIRKILKSLEAQNMVALANGRWTYAGGEFHVGKDSPAVLMHHQNWRARALLDAQDTENTNLHYTVVQTMSKADAERIKQMLLRFIEESSQIAGPSRPEEAVAITCDFFKV